MNRTTTSVPPHRLLLLVAGFVIWSIAFVVLYGLNAIGCAFGWPELLQRGILLFLFAMHSAALIWLTFWCRKRWKRMAAANEPAPMIEYVGYGLTVAALASTLFVLAPTFFITMCV